MALRLCQDEGVSAEVQHIAELAALLHDIADWKYSGSEEAGAEAANEFLTSKGVDASIVSQVCEVIRGVSFHAELGGAGAISPALAIVQVRADVLISVSIVSLSSFNRACRMRIDWMPLGPLESPAALRTAARRTAPSTTRSIPRRRCDDGCFVTRWW